VPSGHVRSGDHNHAPGSALLLPDEYDFDHALMLGSPKAKRDLPGLASPSLIDQQA
jgi:hypothetical protein